MQPWATTGMAPTATNLAMAIGVQGEAVCSCPVIGMDAAGVQLGSMPISFSAATS